MAFRETVIFFYTPSNLILKQAKISKQVRLGGLVEKGSFHRLGDGVTVTFNISDLKEKISVRYSGILPDLFREGSGVVVQGCFQDRIFYASQVLAKHDERYRPSNINYRPSDISLLEEI